SHRFPGDTKRRLRPPHSKGGGNASFFFVRLSEAKDLGMRCARVGDPSPSTWLRMTERDRLKPVPTSGKSDDQAHCGDGLQPVPPCDNGIGVARLGDFSQPLTDDALRASLRRLRAELAGVDDLGRIDRLVVDLLLHYFAIL